jgi:hypothetical protein
MVEDPYLEDRQLAAPKEIVDIVERFENNLESYKSGHYNETQVRREFVDPFFKALGWYINACKTLPTPARILSMKMNISFLRGHVARPPKA